MKRILLYLLFYPAFLVTTTVCSPGDSVLRLRPVLRTGDLGTPEGSHVLLLAYLDEHQVPALSDAVDKYGFVWSTHPDNTLEHGTVVELSGVPGKEFFSYIRGLQSRTRYFARSFMVIDGEVFYGNESSFVTAAGSWRRLKDFPGEGFARGTAFSLLGRAYVISGGQVWLYNPETDAWQQKNPFPVVTEGPTSFVIGENAYVYCGSLYQYQVVTDSWLVIELPEDEWIQRGCRGVGSFVIDGKIYIGGGLGNLNKGFSVFDPKKKTWIYMPFNHQSPNVSYAAIFAVNNIGYVVCGEQSGESPTSTVISYDVRESKWNRHTLSTPAGQEITAGKMLSLVIDDEAYIIYGRSAEYLFHFNDLTKVSETQTIPFIYKDNDHDRIYRKGGIAFSIDGKGYVGLGVDPDDDGKTLLTDFWEFTPN